MNPYYREYSDFLADTFSAGKVQKLSIDAAFGCPNRDGTIGRGGCIYCNNASFSPDAGKRFLPIEEQIEAGKRFFARKYPTMRYLAYFQSYTSTHAPVPTLIDLYQRALAADGVIGLVIGTRPDCMPDHLLSALAEINRHKPVIVEYGAESSHDATLHAVNRCHTWAQTVDAVQRTQQAGIATGLHLIMGLPGETREMMLSTIDAVAALGIDTIKLHQMQVIRGTELHRQYQAGTCGPLAMMDLDEYLDLCVETVKRLPHSTAIDRFVAQAPSDMLVAPRWGLKNYEFTALLLKRLNACRG